MSPKATRTANIEAEVTTAEIGNPVPEEAIRRRAYDIYLERGEQPDCDLDDWLQAERELQRGNLDWRAGWESLRGATRTHCVISGTRKTSMIDHIILTVNDFERSVAFYARALKPLGITYFIDYEGHDGHPDLKGFGDGKRAFFWLKKGKPDPQAVHVGFAAKDHAEVDAFYKAAVDAGGKSKESPQARPEYYPGYYAAWVLDPDGHDIEVVHKS